jgi:hypothetical protein
MPKLSRSHLTIAAATAAAAVGGTAVAGATGTTSTTTTTERPAGPRETPLTGSTKDKVQAAALAKVAGTVLRVETERGGAYEAHIRKADGTEVEVKVSKAFEVTAVEEGGRRGDGPGHGHGGPGGHADLTAIATKLGVTEAALQKAVEDARPADTGKDRGADRAADLAKALGVETAKVQTILDANRPQRGDRGDRGGPGPRRPDDTALVSALAKGLSKTEAEVQAALTKAEEAHRADHEARETAMYAAVAKALGKDAADVKAAFEASRPTP